MTNNCYRLLKSQDRKENESYVIPAFLNAFHILSKIFICHFEQQSFDYLLCTYLNQSNIQSNQVKKKKKSDNIYKIQRNILLKYCHVRHTWITT